MKNNALYCIGHCSLGAVAAVLVTVATPTIALAQQHSGGETQSSHESGSSHSNTGHDSGSEHSSKGKQGKGSKGGASGESAKGGKGSLEDIFRDVAGEEEDSDRPAWAGAKGGKNEHGGKPGSAGSARGDVYGDMYVILRDVNGNPILNAAGFVQPIDKDGNLIPLDAEGAPVDPTLAQEVEIGRLNAGRSPDQVLDQRAEEVVSMLNTATAITTDAAGRLVVTTPEGTSTIDAPLENLAIYVALMTKGTIPGVTDLPGTQFDHLVDGQLTTADLVSATSFLAAAADKFTSLSPDAIAYENAILDIGTKKVGTVTYSDVDYSRYSYDRSAIYGDITATVLVKQADGSYVPTSVNIYEAVFGSKDYSGTGTFEAFATATDDARAIVNYIHEYEVPADVPPTK